MKHRSWFISLIPLIALSVVFVGCVTVPQRRQRFYFQPNRIVIEQTSNRVTLESYRHPATSRVQRNYEIRRHGYAKQSKKLRRALNHGHGGA